MARTNSRFVLDPERLVVALLEADGGDRLAAQAASAHRTRIGSGQHLEIIGQRLQPLHAAKQRARALFGAGGKLGAAEIADHQRVAGQHEPWFVCSGAVGDEHRDVLRRMAGRVQHLDGDVAELKHFAIAHATEGKCYVGSGEQHVVGAGGFGERAAGGNVIGVKVRVDDVADAHAGLRAPPGDKGRCLRPDRRQPLRRGRRNRTDRRWRRDRYAEIGEGSCGTFLFAWQTRCMQKASLTNIIQSFK